VTDVFPPTSAAALLALCAGEWLSLRSRFQPAASDDDWHDSDKGELKVQWSPASNGEGLGTLAVQGPNQCQGRLTFHSNGSLSSGDGQQGQWRLQADGRLELEHSAGGCQLTETIWFRKPNLRLRSLLIWRAGELQGARFCSEIRRVSR
jgi:hypothetical protein